VTGNCLFNNSSNNKDNTTRLEMRGKAHRLAHPAQTRLQNSGYWAKVYHISVRCSGVIGCVKACMLRSCYLLWNSIA